jgi:GWxTD domain-containing protein
VAALCLAAVWALVPTERASASVTAPQVADAAGLEVTLLRTWAPEDVTVVDGLVNVPLAMLAGGTTGAYRFEVTVFDGQDAQLYRDSWERQLSQQAAAFAESGTSDLLEAFRFGLMPGAYEVEVRAYPTDAPDLGVMARIPLMAFDDRPVTSDLFLATRVEPIAEGAGGGSWSVTHGGFGIATAARMAVLPTEPDIYYYLELYGRGDQTTRAQVNAEVRSGERALFRTPVTEVDVEQGGTPFTGQLSLEGLPPGEYELVMNVETTTASTGSSATFRMLDPVDEVAVGGDRSYEGDYFASLSDEELERTFGGVAVLITDTERVTFEAFPPDAKRRYLTEFFRHRDPDPASVGNQFLDDYIERVATIRARYEERVGTEERLPWFTDRGRIYLVYGEPEERLVNYSPTEFGTPGGVIGSGGFAGEPPYEIWRYQTTGFVYLFIESDQFGNWRLIYSTDPDIASLADWYERSGPAALQDLKTNFGINPRFVGFQ